MRSIIIGEGRTLLQATDTAILDKDTTIQRVIIHKDVRIIGRAAFHGKHQIKEVIFQSGSLCHTISEKAFLWCFNLQKIQLPFSLINIRKQAFQFCASLQFILVPPLVKYIDSLSFSYCPMLRIISILGENVKINSNAFVLTAIKECQLNNQRFLVTHVHGQLLFYNHEREVADKKVAYGTLVNNIVDGKPQGDKKFVVWYKEERYGPWTYTGYGNKLKEAIDDLDFFEIHKDIPDKLKNLTENDYITMEEYQILTHDCKYGVEQFLVSHNIPLDSKMQIKDILSIAENNPRGRPHLLKRFIEENKTKEGMKIDEK